MLNNFVVNLDNLS